MKRKERYHLIFIHLSISCLKFIAYCLHTIYVLSTLFLITFSLALLFHYFAFPVHSAHAEGQVSYTRSI